MLSCFAAFNPRKTARFEKNKDTVEYIKEHIKHSGGKLNPCVVKVNRLSNAVSSCSMQAVEAAALLTGAPGHSHCVVSQCT